MRPGRSRGRSRRGSPPAGCSHCPRSARRRRPRRLCPASRRAGSRSNWCREMMSVLCAAVVRRPSTRSGGRPVGERRGPAAIDDQPLRAVRHFEGQGRGAARRGHLRRGRRRCVDDQHGPQRRHAVIAPAACLAQRPGAKAAAFDQRVRGVPASPGVAALPARQGSIAHRHAMKSGERGGRRGFDRVGQALLGREISAAKQRKPVDEQHACSYGVRLISPPSSNCAVDKARASPDFAARDARNSALNEQAGRHQTGPGGDPIEARRRLVRIGVEMPGTAHERVEQGRAIARVAARQDVGRISGPEEDALAPQVGPPCLVDAGAVGEEPASGEGFRQPRTLFPRRGRGKIAKPGEALQRVRRRTARRRGSRNRASFS